MADEEVKKFLEQFRADYINGVDYDVDSIIEATQCLLCTGEWLPIHQGVLQTIDNLIEQTQKYDNVDINFNQYCFLNQTKYFKSGDKND